MRKKVLIVFMMFVLLFSTVVSAANIKDISSDHWAYQSVQKLVDEGLLQLYEDGTFRGSDKVSRYQLAAIVARLLEEVESGTVNVSAKDMELLRQLSVEFQEELVDLAVQGDAFAEQIKALEQKNVIQDEFMTEIKDVDINLLQDKIADLKGKIANVESDVSRIIDSILKIKEIEERIAVLEGNDDKQDTLIAENKKDIEALKETNVKITDQTIEDLKNRLSINTTRINALQNEVNQLKSELKSKNTELKQLESKKSDDQTYLYVAGVGLLLLLLSN